jgi:uncharacterized protein YbjQ (UPF0145 family)
MSDSKLTRSQFMRGGSCLAVGVVMANVAPGTGVCSGTPCGQTEGMGSICGGQPALVVRPYQVLCTICRLGETGSARMEGKLGQVAQAIAKTPDMPITLTCNAGDVYAYQDPGVGDDTPEGRDFNRKRDLDILQRMNWAPGTTLPTRTVFACVLERISSVAGICGYEKATSNAWRGCPKARSGFYEKGQKLGIEALVPPRSNAEMAAEKRRSIEAVNSCKAVTIRPHILLCAVCQFGGGTRPPYPADNLPELLDLILHKKPDLLITMVRGANWMMCAPCPRRVAVTNACVNVLGSGGLSNEKRDLDMLQVLGLEFGSTMKARELYRLIFEKIPTTQEICKRDNPSPAVWWDGCGESNMKQGNANYEKGRRELMEAFAQMR